MEKKPLVIYDIECLPNFFCMCFMPLWSDEKMVIEISKRRDDRAKLRSITKFYTIVGYNSGSYDDTITQMVLSNPSATNAELYELSKSIIKRDFDNRFLKKYKYKRDFDSIDIMTMLASSKLRVSLKHLQVKINWPKVQDFEVDWNKDLPEEEFDKCIEYCFNDVGSLKQVVKMKEKDLILRDQIQAKYSLDFRSMDGVKIAENMLCSHIAKNLDIDLKTFMYDPNIRVTSVALKDLINDFIEFKTPEFQAVLDYFKATTVYPKDKEEDNKKQLKYRLIHKGVPFDFGLGGIHAWSNGQILEPKSDEFLIMPDFAGFYPSQVVRLEYKHKHDPFFREKYVEAYNDKIEGKRIGDKLMETLAKLIGNSSFGKFLSFYSPLYSPELAYKITVNGQLMALMLIERLSLGGFRVVGANTDAVEVYVKKERYDEYLAICNDFCTLTKMSLDHDKFTKIYRKSCNHYIGIKADKDGKPMLDENGRYKVKLKGDFDQESDLLKGVKPNIVKMAIFEELVYGTKIEQTVKNCTNIYEFCMASRVGSQYNTIHFNKKLQKTNRYYAGKGPKAAYIYKAHATDPITGLLIVKVEKGKKQPKGTMSHILGASKVLLFNDYEDKPISEYNINYSYYIEEAQKIVDIIKPKQLTLF